MSYTSMYREDHGCDMVPHCGNDFDKTPGVKVAIAKDGEVLAFCFAHSKDLILAGVPLRTLEEVRAELRKPEEDKQKIMRDTARQKFINELKNKK